MGLFERLGERVERIKREVDTAKTESAAYRCRSCEAPVYADLDACPECGSEQLERVRPADSENETAPEEEDAPRGTDSTETPDESRAADGDDASDEE